MVAELMMSCTERLSRAYKVICRIVFLLLLAGASWPAVSELAPGDETRLPLGQPADRWVPLARDKVHDPRGPSIRELQQPSEGLSELPAHPSGNRVRWAVALDRGAIKPRRSIKPDDPEIQVLDMDVLLNLSGSLPAVRFPHKIHTQWLSCDNCHEQLFKSQIGANNIRMYSILMGEQCGYCHGAVAFPLTECLFCHSVQRPTSNTWQLEKLKE